MQMEKFGGKNKSKIEAISEIMAIENQILQSGSVDTEKHDIDIILEELKKDKITPEKALELVKNLEQSRQDYH